MDIIKEIKLVLQKHGILKSDSPVEEMISYEVVYEPDTVDSHGHWMSKDTLEKGCSEFNKNLKEGIVKSNLFHLEDTDMFTVEDTWIHKEFDVSVDATGEKIKAGTWISKIQYHDENLWKLKKANVIGGVSIGAKGFLNEETGEITNLKFDEDIGEDDDASD